MKSKIIENIKAHYSGWTGGVHKQAVDIVESLIENYDVHIEDYETTEEFIQVLEDEGYIHQSVDSHVPVYNTELYYWVKDNGHHVTDAINEYGYDYKMSFEEMISQGYFYQLENLVKEILWNNWIEEYKEGIFQVKDGRK